LFIQNLLKVDKIKKKAAVPAVLAEEPRTGKQDNESKISYLVY